MPNLTHFTPSASLEELSDIQLDTLKVYCPRWINRIATAKIWYDVWEHEEEFPFNPMIGTNSCIVGECMGGYNHYSDKSSDKYNHLLTKIGVYFLRDLRMLATRVKDDDFIVYVPYREFVKNLKMLADTLYKGVDGAIKSGDH